MIRVPGMLISITILSKSAIGFGTQRLVFSFGCETLSLSEETLPPSSLASWLSWQSFSPVVVSFIFLVTFPLFFLLFFHILAVLQHDWELGSLECDGVKACGRILCSPAALGWACIYSHFISVERVVVTTHHLLLAHHNVLIHVIMLVELHH
jgi:hypothetical protein